MLGWWMKYEDRFPDFSAHNMYCARQIRIVRYDKSAIKSPQMRVMYQMHAKINIGPFFLGTVDMHHIRHHAMRIYACPL